LDSRIESRADGFFCVCEQNYFLKVHCSFPEDVARKCLPKGYQGVGGQSGEKPAGKRSANFLRLAPCASRQLSLASNPESRPAALVMVVTDF